jgi:Protein of unknown function (DUF2630)
VNDQELMDSIEALEAEESRLRRHEETSPDPDTRAQIEVLNHALERLWDLRRQRNALREAGRDADAASLRDADTVEAYDQ